MRITVLAPAKVNLTMHVLGRRADGYHTVETVMQTVDLTDTVTVEPAGELSLVTGSDALPPDDSNTAWRAAQKFCAAAGIPAAFAITLQKRIPMQAGLAGGSADAAGVLTALNALCHTPFDSEALCAVGAEVGADVPFCLRGGTMLATGTGTVLTSLPPLPESFLVLAKPPVGVSTAAAYAAVDAYPFPAVADTGMAAALKTGSLAAVGAAMFNRFAEVLRLPEVDAVRRRLLDAGALGACMTGSGSAVVGLFADEKTANAAEKAVRLLCETAVVCRPWRGGPKIV